MLAPESEPKYKRPVIYKTIQEPVILRELLANDVFLLGGQFAILCQWAHPGLAKGSLSRSNFASRIPGRLRNTARFVNAALYGTQEEKEAIFSVIHRYHASVHGPGYDANDPELHKWTAATLFVSMVLVYEIIMGEMPIDVMTTMFKESAIWGTSLRMAPEMWPDTLDEFWEYWNYNIATLKITDEARQLCQALLYPSNLPLYFHAMLPMSRLITSNILPARLAKEYSLEPSPSSKALFQVVTYGLSTGFYWLPESVRQFRHRYYLDDLKKAAAKIRDTGHWGQASEGNAGEPKLHRL